RVCGAEGGGDGQQQSSKQRYRECKAAIHTATSAASPGYLSFGAATSTDRSVARSPSCSLQPQQAPQDLAHDLVRAAADWAQARVACGALSPVLAHVAHT